MQAKKYQVFVSSTYRDLIEERREVIEAIIDLGHIPAGMEGFPAIDIEQFKYIQKVIDQCDYYIVVVAGKYGSLASDGISFTEKEYRYAVDSGKVVIGFVIDEAVAASLPVEKIEADPVIKARLEAFRADVMKGRLIRAYSDRNSLAKSVMKALVAAFDEFPREGWVRASTAASEDILSQINELRNLNDALIADNEALRGQLAPKIDNLASLDDQYEILYSYHNARYKQRDTGSKKLSWRDIFFAIAPNVSIARPSRMIGGYVESYLKNRGMTSATSLRLNPISVDQIHVQMIALGLLDGYTGKGTDGKMYEWVRITERGHSLWTESTVVRGNAGLAE